MSITPLESFPYQLRNYNNITPFTYRDGLTYLEVLEGLRDWLYNVLVPHIDEEIGGLNDNWHEQVDGIVANVTAQLEAQSGEVASDLAAMTTLVNNAVSTIINATIVITDPVMTGVFNNVASTFRGALTTLFAPRDGAPRIMKKNTDAFAGTFDWEHDGVTGYVNHYRTGPNSAAGTAHTAFGTDKGSASGILISHKNNGSGMQVAHNPGSGFGIYLNGYSANESIYAEAFKGSGGVTIQTAIGQGFNNGVTTQGSSTFNCATAAFTAADVGAQLLQLTTRGLSDAYGSIPAGSTIVSVTDATTVVMSTVATITSSGILFKLGGRIPDTTQNLLRIRDTDNTAIFEIKRSGVNSYKQINAKAVNPADIPVLITGAVAQTAELLKVITNGGAAGALSVTASGLVAQRNGTSMSNAGLATSTPLTVSNYATSVKSALIIGAAGQTADQLALQDSANIGQSRFDANGHFMTRKSAAPADTALTNGELSFWIDATPGATKAMFKAKDSSGTVRTGSIPLA